MRRTDTTAIQRFSLPFPNAATFDFTNPAYITIAIPLGSKWRMPYHWHETNIDGKSMGCVEGKLLMDVAVVREDGGRTTHLDFTNSPQRTLFDITKHVGWMSAKTDAQKRNQRALKVEYEGDQALHRTLCSAIMDRDIYPKLDSTPVWVAAMFALFSSTPKAKSWLLDRMLDVQLEMIYHQYDFHIHHGSIWFQLPWLLFSWGHSHPPLWTGRANTESLFVISKTVMLTRYWTGRLFLGMKGEYPEYTPSEPNLAV